MEYKLLDNGTAVILTRQPKLFYDYLYVDFSCAPSGATAIFENFGNSYYRELCDGKCSIPVKMLHGEIKVTVVILDGTTPAKKWVCEELKAETQADGGILISPNDMNLPQTVVALKLENQEIRIENKALKDRLSGLEKRLDEIMGAYDFT